jgi:hypothetical protein
MEYTVDIRDIVAFGEKSAAVVAMIPQKLDKAGRASGLAVQRFAQAGIPVASSTAKAQTQMSKVEASIAGVTVEVTSSAQSAAGYPYPWVLEEGTTGDILPKNGRYLVFPGSDGKTVFTTRVRKREGTHFMQKALDAAGPFIEQQFENAYGELLQEWAS